MAKNLHENDLLKIIAPNRGNDVHGSGAYHAPRGERVHKGVDKACYKDSLILAISAGLVTKIGYPYNPGHPIKGHLRYVEITDKDGLRLRYFYVKAIVEVGERILKNQVIGKSQGLGDIYKGIIDHIHLEILDKNDTECNPDFYVSTSEL